MNVIYHINGIESGKANFAFPSSLIDSTGEYFNLYSTMDIESQVLHMVYDFKLQSSFRCFEHEHQVVITLDLDDAEMVLFRIGAYCGDWAVVERMQESIFDLEKVRHMIHEIITLDNSDEVYALYNHYKDIKLNQRILTQPNTVQSWN